MIKPNKILKPIPAYPITIFYEDTDASGRVYHANYLKYFERARSAWFLNNQVSQQQLLQQQLAFVVTEQNIRYIKPALFEQQLVVATEITTIKKVRIIFQQQLIHNEQSVCTATTTVALIHLLKQRPYPIPNDLLEELSCDK